MTTPYDPPEPDISEVELMHDTNAAAWRRMIKEIANAEIEFIMENEAERSVTIVLNNGRKFTVSKIPYAKVKKVHSLGMAFEYLFSKLEAFPMAMEVKEE